jgi:hypothetical protein
MEQETGIKDTAQIRLTMARYSAATSSRLC